jgi:hypothetical protein
MTWDRKSVQLGPARVECYSCNRTINTGRSEWPELSGAQKRSFLLRGTWIIAFLAMFLLMLAPAISQGLVFVLYLFLLCALFPVLIVASRLLQRWLSMQRYAKTSQIDGQARI